LATEVPPNFRTCMYQDFLMFSMMDDKTLL